ncbi:MAG TPA: hypothetical protein VML75_17525, partial [Kofleriaceae bacterium]|nr:hypothetical protein [Kofleriaceae bacterium]
MVEASLPPRRGVWLREVVMSDRTAWIAVALVSLSTFVAVGSMGRLPSVDLPQHAVILRRMIEGGGSAYEVSWSTPYLILFLIARVFSWFTDPMTAIWLATAFAIAALPLSSAVLAASLRRSPALGCFALLAAFSEVTGWGFASLLVGANAMCLALAAAVYYARSPSTGRGAWVAAAIALSYWSHILACLVTVPAVWWIVVLRMRPLGWRKLWPLVLGTGVSAGAFVLWNISREVPEIMRSTALLDSHGPGVGQRILEIPARSASFGRTGELAGSWTMLLLVLVATIAASASYGVVRRRARLVSPQVRRSWREVAARLALPSILVASVLCYLLAPLTR